MTNEHNSPPKQTDRDIPMRILWSNTDDRFIRDFDTAIELVRSEIIEFVRPYSSLQNEKSREHAALRIQNIAKALFNIDGIIQVGFDKYAVRIRIAKAFSWDGEYGRMPHVCEVFAHHIFLEQEPQNVPIEQLEGKHIILGKNVPVNPFFDEMEKQIQRN